VPNIYLNLGARLMSFIRHKVIKNKTYAYEVTSYWDPELKRSKSISKYLGPVDQTTNKVVKFIKKERGNEKLILDFGDAYFLYQFITKSDIYCALKTCFFDRCPEVLALLIYRLCSHSPMYNCDEWIDGSILKILFKDSNFSSQRISNVMSFLGDESIQRTFFTDYIKLIGGSSKSVIIDATSLPNQINIDFNAWGRSDGKIEKQFRLLCVVDQASKTPLFYRFLPGNVTDIVTLQTTLLELKAMGVNNSYVLIDAGYFSESNICDLYQRRIDFLTRLPAGRKIYKDIILNKLNDIEDLKNATTTGKRSFFIKPLTVDLYGYIAYVFVILDPERKAKETKELLQKYCNDKSERDEMQDKLEFLSCGVMILVSSKNMPVTEVLSSYYLRQSVEQIFGFSKSDLGLLPIRNHNENTVRGYLFFQFILLIFYIKIREKIIDEYTVEQALLILRKLKCKVYNTQAIPTELTKKQRLIFEQMKILVPKFLGI
jgi:transposase